MALLAWVIFVLACIALGFMNGYWFGLDKKEKQIKKDYILIGRKKNVTR